MKCRTEPRDRSRREQWRHRHGVKLLVQDDKRVGRPVCFRLVGQLRKGKRNRSPLGLASIEEELLLQRGNQNALGVDPATQTFQGGQSGGAILVRAGKGLQKGVVARENCSRTRDLLVTLLDQFLENLGARAQARVNLRNGVLAIRVPDNEIGNALQQRQERDEKEEEAAPETVELKPQG